MVLVGGWGSTEKTLYCWKMKEATPYHLHGVLFRITDLISGEVFTSFTRSHLPNLFLQPSYFSYPALCIHQPISRTFLTDISDATFSNWMPMMLPPQVSCFQSLPHFHGRHSTFLPAVWNTGSLLHFSFLLPRMNPLRNAASPSLNISSTQSLPIISLPHTLHIQPISPCWNTALVSYSVPTGHSPSTSRFHTAADRGF